MSDTTCETIEVQSIKHSGHYLEILTIPGDENAEIFISCYPPHAIIDSIVVRKKDLKKALEKIAL